jgi:hypothetical protein
MALSYGLNTTRFRSYAELKAAHPNVPDGVYALFPQGRSGPIVQTYCMTHEGDHYQLVWKQLGGSRYSTFGTNVSDYELITNRQAYDTEVKPYSVSGEMGSRINVNGYNFWKDQRDVTWLKLAKGYTSAGILIPPDSQYTFDVKLIYDSNVCMADTWQNLTQPTQVPGYVSMYIDGSNYGRTRYIQGYPVDYSIGFANAENGDNQGVPEGEDIMNGWSARHVLSYVYSSNGRDATRCQFRCWDGSEDVAQEILWFVKYNYE